MNISYHNLSYSIAQKSKERIILNNISGNFSKGLNAILGGSGAGKITLNGIEYDNQMFQKFACYVMQENILLPTLTVREYLEFAANPKLKLLSQEDRHKQVTKIIKLLMLQKCENTLIEDHINKGISGGEKKRVCIGIELLGNPKVLFLDEPTSGLDSFTAYMIIKMLKDFANQENLEGKFIYNGPRNEIIDYFGNKGFACPKYSNPADYLMNIMQSQEYDIYKKLWIQEDQDQQNITVYSSVFQKTVEQFKDNLQKQNKFNNFFYSLNILTKRQVLNLKRNILLLKARFFQSLFMNIFLGLIYLNQSNKTSTPQEFLQVCKSILLIGLGSLFSCMNPQAIAFSSERAVFLKEENSKIELWHLPSINQQIENWGSYELLEFCDDCQLNQSLGCGESNQPIIMMNPEINLDKLVNYLAPDSGIKCSSKECKQDQLSPSSRIESKLLVNKHLKQIGLSC
ncbi:hypothetical protein ABPG72_011178 [Tetrahymena utriculariae]